MAADIDTATMKMALSLAVIICVIIALFIVIRRFPFGPLSGGKTPIMRILGTLNLAPKRAIALVEICDQWMVIGIGMDTVTLISKIDRQADSPMPSPGEPGSGGKFQNFLDSIHSRGKISEMTGNK